VHQLRLSIYPILAFSLSIVIATGLFISNSLGKVGTIMAAQSLWSTDHETGEMSQWWYPGGVYACGGEFNSDGGTSGVSTTVARSGLYSARLNLPNVGAGTQGARLFRWCEARANTALYYSAWYYIPQEVTVRDWWALMEWKSAGSYNAKFAVYVDNRPDGQMYLLLGRGQDSGGGSWRQDLKNVPVGQWFHLEAYYRKASDNTGQITIWQDGVQILGVVNVQTANSSDLGWAVTNYGAQLSPSNVTIYVDDAVINTYRTEPTFTLTPRPTNTLTAMASALATPSGNPTLTPTGTVTPAAASTNSATATATNSPTPRSTSTATTTPTATATITLTVTPTATARATVRSSSGA
jgi:hypothetical protein